MDRVHWDGFAQVTTQGSLPDDLAGNLFKYLPAEIPFTAQMERLANRYVNNEIDWRYYPAFQAAAFLRPKTESEHKRRRAQFDELRRSAEAQGFSVPSVFCELVDTDNYVDRLRHNAIWLELPEELWRLPAEPSQVMFLMFTEGQGCCHWHLLLKPDRTHSVVCSQHAFGCRSAWMSGNVPDYSKWEVHLCADSVEEWLYHFFTEASEHDKQYLDRLSSYFDSEDLG